MKPVLLAVTLLASTLFAKSPVIEWDSTYGADKEDKALAIAATKDGGAVVAGTTRSFSLGKEDFYLFKVDSNGKQLWEKRFGGARKDIAYGVATTSEDKIYLTGTSKSYSKEGDYDLYAGKFDKEGKLLWAKSLGGASKDYGYDLTTTTDGGIVIVGKTKSFGHGHYDMYVLKLSPNGKVLWSKAFGGTTNEEAYGVTQLPDGSLIIVGATESFGAGDFDYYVVKLAKDGKKLWEKYYGEKKDDMLYAVTAHKDGSFTATGFTRSYNSKKKDLSVVHFSKEGEILWHKIVGRANHEIAHDIETTDDDGVIVVGSTKSKGHGKNDFYVLVFDKNGKLLVDKTYGGKKNDVANAVAKVSDKSYIIAGESESFGDDTEYDAYLLKIKLQ